MNNHPRLIPVHQGVVRRERGPPLGVGGGRNTKARQSYITTTSNFVDNAQDCLGMTPLHILACSTNQNLDLCRFIVASFSNSLITEDKWGCPPLLYAIWSGAPHEMLHFLVNVQKAAFPNHILDWDKMLETLCRAGASLETVGRLLLLRCTSFPEQSVNW